MTDAILAELEQATGLHGLEVIGTDVPAERLHQLQRQLTRFFPEHAHVAGELAEAWAGDWPDDQVVIHAWLLLLDDEPVGFTVFHTSLRRLVVLQHFVGMDAEAGRRLPLRWVKALADAVLAAGIRDGEAHGVTILAAIGENHPEHARTWERYGYVTLDVDYREPEHGRHWRDHGALSFFPMTPQLRRTDAGSRLPLGEVAEAGLRAFLVDHYLLPEDEPTVVRTLSLARGLPEPR